MALKLINVLAITILSKVSASDESPDRKSAIPDCTAHFKDNCLFRTKPRMHLDVVRQGTLVSGEI